MQTVGIRPLAQLTLLMGPRMRGAFAAFLEAGILGLGNVVVVKVRRTMGARLSILGHQVI
jgi:hypothetical protein